MIENANIHPLSGDLEEMNNTEVLSSMMGVSTDQALRVLRKHNGDVNKAVDAMLGGDRGEEEGELGHTGIDAANSLLEKPPAGPSAESGQRLQAQESSATVIDLTRTEDVSQVQDARGRQQEVKFGPSDRAPEPGWQMVTTTNQTDTAENTEERSLKSAIQASLQDLNGSDESEVFRIEKTSREGGRPIALRTKTPGVSYAALALQALFMVPQMRNCVSKFHPPETIDFLSPLQHSIWKLVELFTNLDLAQLSAIVDDDVVHSFVPQSWDGTTGSIAEISSNFIRRVAESVEAFLDSDNDRNAHLFSFTHTRALCLEGNLKFERRFDHGNIVIVDANLGSSPPDLISKLSETLCKPERNGIIRDIIAEPSEILVFRLHHSDHVPSSNAAAPKELFAFPKNFYLDRFLVKNLKIAEDKRIQERELQEEIRIIAKKKEFLTHHNGRDIIKDLRSTLHYYEHVAESKGDAEREEAIIKTKEKLQQIISKIEKSGTEIDQRVDELQHEVASIYDCLELQHDQYDLRAVLLHTGLPGRKHIYSYVQDTQGVWWKIQEHYVTEVPVETVFADPAGLHLGAGPYMLIYSQRLPEEVIKTPQQWPDIFVKPVEESNQHFLSCLAADCQGDMNESGAGAGCAAGLVPEADLTLAMNNTLPTSAEIADSTVDVDVSVIELPVDNNGADSMEAVQEG